MRGLFSHLFMMKFDVRKNEIMKGLADYIKYLEDLKKSIENEEVGNNDAWLNQAFKEKYKQQLKSQDSNPWNITWDEILEGPKTK